MEGWRGGVDDDVAGGLERGWSGRKVLSAGGERGRRMVVKAREKRSRLTSMIGIIMVRECLTMVSVKTLGYARSRYETHNLRL